MEVNKELKNKNPARHNFKPLLLNSVYSPNRSSHFPNNIAQERAVDTKRKCNVSQI